MEARWYQLEAVDKVFDYFSRSPKKHPLVVCPTGAGKSFILSLVCKCLVEQGHRVLVLSHVEDILTQDEKSILKVLPIGLVGVYAASLKRRERKRVTVASINSVYKKAELFTTYKYIIIDEAHTIPHKDDGMYRTFISLIANVTVLGLTATPFRLGSGYLIDGEKALFDDIVFDVPVEKLIQQGYLSKLFTSETNNNMSVDGLRTLGGDYVTSSMNKKFNQLEVTEKICAEIATYATAYKHILLFAIDIEHAESLSTLLNQNNITARAVHSKQPYKVRRDNIQAFKTGKIQALASVATLTTGFDYPEIDLIALVRPTKSPVLHVQMIGRGLRVAAGKAHCRVLDFAGNILRLGPINAVHVFTKGDSNGRGEAPVKVCVGCSTHLHTGAKVCYICGYIFPPPQTKLKQFASGLEIVLLAKENQNGWHAVISVFYAAFKSQQGIDSMRVTYTLGTGKIIHEYVNPFGNTRSNYNWRHWWEYRTEVPVPSSVRGLVNRSKELKVPATIEVDFSGKHPRITNASF